MPKKKGDIKVVAGGIGASAPERPIKKTNQLLKGFKDILPDEQKYWQHVFKSVEKVAQQYRYLKIDSPILEETSLFVRTVGKETDIVSKEMYTFTDAGGDLVSLRPEATASIARAYIEHGMMSLPQPVKLYYVGPMFRRENPQSGRFRQFYQFGFEVLGGAGPVIDAQNILVAYNICVDLGFKPDAFTVQINSIGCQNCRGEYKKELVNFYKAKRKFLCGDCKKRLIRNPLRLLDCKVEGCRAIRRDAPQILDWLDDECKAHFMGVLEFLDALEVSYVLNPHLVRGLDYYTRTVFELWMSQKEDASQNSLGSGGRYDALVESLGGPPTPACGFAFGIERLVQLMKLQEVKVKDKKSPDIFIAQIGQQAKIRAMKLFEMLRNEGILAYEAFSKDSLKTQLELANKLQVKYAIIIGQKEVLDGTVLVRDMEAGIQEIINYEKVASDVKKKLSSA